MEEFEAVYEEVLHQAEKFIAENFRPFESIETIATHGGFSSHDLSCMGSPVVSPICLSTTFEQKEPGVARYDYSRAGNFSRECLEKCIAELERGHHCSAYSSGLACLGAIVQLLSVGDHIVAFDDMYGGSVRYLRTIASRSGILCTFVDLRNEDAFKAVLQPNTKLILAETPSNPLMRLIDIRRISDIAHDYNKDIIVAVDNTFMTPYFQRPLDFGADISWHSLTKYMNGHSDVVMGAVITRNHPELPAKFKFSQLAGGAVPSSFDCFLCLRGLRTLPVRMRGHMLNALVVAKMLEKHPKVEKVIHPGLPSHPQHKLALEQMRGFSGIITIYVKCTAEETVKFVKNIKLFALAESLGGYESLIEIPSIMTHISVPYEIRLQNGILDNMIRLSVGLEDPKDLVRALYEGLDALGDRE
ncbi:Cystathionine gamma-lyase [Clonorchis sinensis]|uniref:Cystathionine gamma-lyase n=2 Tax=Clonorchis sinensis TaxID=79923 RepID=A0A8T1M4K3_CLOSI|nr:Cystathionine gamma-lyase [Clonorchis sinensis]GAA48377.1 cystathionine gamma-lyase [Clonorchis sinensis]